MKAHLTPRLGASATLFVLLAGATIAPSRAGAAPDSTLVSEKEEITVGQHMAEQAQEMYGQALAADDPMSLRVRRIGQALAHLSGRRHIPYSYQVLANDQIMNAFSVAGGPIFITRKLVAMTSNDAELAYVLGHETGHIDRKHLVSTIETHRKAAQWAAWLGDSLGSGGDFARLATYLGYAIWSLGYSRNQETEADILGVRWMSQLGYDPHAAIAMLVKFEKIHPGGAPRFFSTHPGAADREARINALIADEKLEDVAARHGGPRLWTTGTPWGDAAIQEAHVQVVRHAQHLAARRAAVVAHSLGL